MNKRECKPCDKCPVWEKLSKDSRYRIPVSTRTIGGRLSNGVVFQYHPPTSKACDELEIMLPRPGGTSVTGYPKAFTEGQLKEMCCRFACVVKTGPAPPSAFVGNKHFNPPHWAPSSFANKRIDPPYVVAVVRKVLEDNPALDITGYCAKCSGCK